MSILGLTSAPSIDPGDHTPIIRRLEIVEWGNSQYERWCAGCICGFYNAGRVGYYIPSRVQAERLYEAHLPSSDIGDMVTKEEIHIESNTERHD